MASFVPLTRVVLLVQVESGSVNTADASRSNYGADPQARHR